MTTRLPEILFLGTPEELEASRDELLRIAAPHVVAEIMKRAPVEQVVPAPTSPGHPRSEARTTFRKPRQPRMVRPSGESDELAQRAAQNILRKHGYQSR
jgi:hypothetical protein